MVFDFDFVIQWKPQQLYTIKNIFCYKRIPTANQNYLLFYSILLHSDSVSMEFSGQDNDLFRGSKQGRVYLTSHRMIFNSKKPSDAMQSFSAPFVALSDVSVTLFSFRKSVIPSYGSYCILG